MATMRHNRTHRSRAARRLQQQSREQGTPLSYAQALNLVRNLGPEATRTERPVREPAVHRTTGARDEETNRTSGPGAGENTAVTLLYRDGDNYKAAATVVFSGRLSERDRQRFHDALDEGRYLIGTQVGLAHLGSGEFPDFPSASDHVWHEVDAIADTDAPPTDPRTITDFVAEVCNTAWNERDAATALGIDVDAVAWMSTPGGPDGTSGGATSVRATEAPVSAEPSDDADGTGPGRLLWFVESGAGDRLSTPTRDERVARTTARRLGERLCAMRQDDDTDTWLVFDYGARIASGADDGSGYWYCDECDTWITGELVNPQHAPECSLHPDNVLDVATLEVATLDVATPEAATCRFCDRPVGQDYHIAGVIDPEEGNIVCDACWDERLR